MPRQPCATRETWVASGLPGICNAGRSLRTCSDRGDRGQVGISRPRSIPGRSLVLSRAFYCSPLVWWRRHSCGGPHPLRRLGPLRGLRLRHRGALRLFGGRPALDRRRGRRHLHAHGGLRGVQRRPLAGGVGAGCSSRLAPRCSRSLPALGRCPRSSLLVLFLALRPRALPSLDALAALLALRPRPSPSPLAPRPRPLPSLRVLALRSRSSSSLPACARRPRSFPCLPALRPRSSLLVLALRPRYSPSLGALAPLPRKSLLARCRFWPSLLVLLARRPRSP